MRTPASRPTLTVRFARFQAGLLLLATAVLLWGIHDGITRSGGTTGILVLLACSVTLYALALWLQRPARDLARPSTGASAETAQSTALAAPIPLPATKAPAVAVPPQTVATPKSTIPPQVPIAPKPSEVPESAPASDAAQHQLLSTPLGTLMLDALIEDPELAGRILVRALARVPRP